MYTNPNMPENTIPSKEEIEPEKDLVVWTAPARPFKKRNRDFYVNILAIAGITGLILFLVEGWLPVVLVISIVFLVYVMATVEPENIEYKVTSYGIKIAGRLTTWSIMGRFWFTKRLDNYLLVIETRSISGRMELVVRPELEEEITKKLSQYLTHEEIPASNIDKAANWLSRKMPGLK